MEKIPSFTIDHLRLLRGIYVSRKDYLGDQVVTTFDIRMKEPNREPVLGQGELHTIEHLAADLFCAIIRSGVTRSCFGDQWGAVRENYFLMKGDLESRDIVELMRRPSVLSGISREKSPVLPLKIAVIICCTIYPWQNTRLQISFRSVRRDRREEFDISNIMKIGIIVVLIALLTACGENKDKERAISVIYFTTAFISWGELRVVT